MRLCDFVLLFGVIGACSSKNFVAGYGEGDQAAQLAAGLPAWCRTNCERRAACPSPSTGKYCVNECLVEMARFAANESCAAVGERLEACMDAHVCDDLASVEYCGVTLGELSACDGKSTPVDNGDAPPSVGGRAATGSAGAGPDAAVTCADAIVDRGSAGSAGSTSSVTCEQGVSDCSDGHDYEWVCARNSQGQLGCTCFVDSQVTGGFDPETDGCPSLPTVDVGCDWSVAL